MKSALRMLVSAAALSIASTTLPALASPAAQEKQHRESDRDNGSQQHADYSNNTYYRTGNREGYQDYQKKQQRKNHNHKYRNNDDRAAHDYGYQQGWQGQRGYNNNSDNNRPH